MTIRAREIRVDHDNEAYETGHTHYTGQKRTLTRWTRRFSSVFHEDKLSPVYAVIDFGENVARQFKVAEKALVDASFRDLGI